MHMLINANAPKLKFLQHNSAEFREYYRECIMAYVRLPKDTIEPAVKGFCDKLFASGVAVSTYSCEGHIEADDIYVTGSYVGFIVVDLQMQLHIAGRLQYLNGLLYEMYGHEGGFELEMDLSTPTENTCVPDLVVRPPVFASLKQRDEWWAFVTKNFKV